MGGNWRGRSRIYDCVDQLPRIPKNVLIKSFCYDRVGNFTNFDVGILLMWAGDPAKGPQKFGKFICVHGVTIFF